MADDKNTATNPATTKPTGSKLVSNPKPATEFAASGAVIEDQIVGAVDMTHPAVDANPREGTTAEQNRIDFNDPTLTGSEAVEQNLAKLAK